VVLFNENEREIWPKGLFRSRFSILGQAPSKSSFRRMQESMLLIHLDSRQCGSYGIDLFSAPGHSSKLGQVFGRSKFIGKNTVDGVQ
jgi:hypothetical protein